jgi:hypothetical protein
MSLRAILSGALSSEVEGWRSNLQVRGTDVRQDSRHFGEILYTVKRLLLNTLSKLTAGLQVTICSGGICSLSPIFSLITR